jgi:hypothetical protein
MFCRRAKKTLLNGIQFESRCNLIVIDKGFIVQIIPLETGKDEIGMNTTKKTHYVRLAKRENVGSFKSRVIFARDQMTRNAAARVTGSNSRHKICFLTDLLANSDVSKLFHDNERAEYMCS